MAKYMLLAAPVLALASPAILQARQAPAVRLTAISLEGTGCPAGSFSANILGAEAQVALALYDSFSLVTGNGVPIDASLSCDISITASFPEGCTSAVFTKTTRGYTGLAEGATGRLTEGYSLSGGSATPSSTEFTYTSAEWGDGGDDFINREPITVVSNAQTATFKTSLTSFLNAPSSDFISRFDVDSVEVAITSTGTC